MPYIPENTNIVESIKPMPILIIKSINKGMAIKRLYNEKSDLVSTITISIGINDIKDVTNEEHTRDKEKILWYIHFPDKLAIIYHWCHRKISCFWEKWIDHSPCQYIDGEIFYITFKISEKIIVNTIIIKWT